MLTEIRTTTRVGANGSISVQSPELREGESAEVIVVVDRQNPTSSDKRLEAFRQLRKRLALTPEAAEKWIAEIREERAHWREPGT